MNKLFIALVCFSVLALSFAETCSTDSDAASCIADDCGAIPTAAVGDAADYAAYLICLADCGFDANGAAVTDCDTLATCSLECTQTLADGVEDSAAKEYYQCLVDCANSSILAFSMIVLVLAALLF